MAEGIGPKTPGNLGACKRNRAEKVLNPTEAFAECRQDAMRHVKNVLKDEEKSGNRLSLSFKERLL